MDKKPSGAELAAQYVNLITAVANVLASMPTHLSLSAVALYCACALILSCLLRR